MRDVPSLSHPSPTRDEAVSPERSRRGDASTPVRRWFHTIPDPKEARNPCTRSAAGLGGPYPL